MKESELGLTVCMNLGVDDPIYKAGGAQGEPPFVDVLVPLVRPTLTRVVLARHATGQYSTNQVLLWMLMQPEEVAVPVHDEFAERIAGAQEVLPLPGYTWAPEGQTPEVRWRQWLLDTHNNPTYLSELDDSDDGEEMETLAQIVHLAPESERPRTTGDEYSLGLTPDHIAQLMEKWTKVYLRRLEPNVPHRMLV